MPRPDNAVNSSGIDFYIGIDEETSQPCLYMEWETDDPGEAGLTIGMLEPDQIDEMSVALAYMANLLRMAKAQQQN